MKLARDSRTGETTEKIGKKTTTSHALSLIYPLKTSRVDATWTKKSGYRAQHSCDGRLNGTVRGRRIPDNYASDCYSSHSTYGAADNTTSDSCVSCCRQRPRGANQSHRATDFSPSNGQANATSRNRADACTGCHRSPYRLARRQWVRRRTCTAWGQWIHIRDVVGRHDPRQTVSRLQT